MSKDLALITVIINNFNNKRYIEKAILSVIYQTYKNLQILILDDHSTSKQTWAIYEKYIEFDKRIQLVSNEQNMQIFASRMKAIDYIKGEYVLFLDGDDYLDLDFVRHMHDFLIYKDADIVVCNFAFVIENSLFIEQKSKFKKLEYTKEDNLLNFLFETHAASYSQNLMWNKLYKTKIVKEAKKEIVNNNLKNIKLYAGEDFFINSFILKQANKLCIDESFIGNYYRRTDILETRNIKKKKFYLDGTNHINQLTYDIFIKNSKDEVLYQNFEKTVLVTLSQYLFLFQLDINWINLKEVSNYLRIKDINEIKKRIELNSNEWLIPKTFKYESYINYIKKKLNHCDDLTFSLSNSIFISPKNFHDEYKQYYILNYQILDLLFLALFQNKKVNIAYDEKNKIHEKLKNELVSIIKKLDYNLNLLNFVSLSPRILDHFNIILDQLRIYQYSLNEIWKKSKAKDFFKKVFKNDLETLNKTEELFYLTCLISNNIFHFNKKSIFNYDYKMFYLLFISLYMNTHNEFQTFFVDIKQIKNIKEIMFHIYYHTDYVYEDVFFNLEQANALKLEKYFLDIIKNFYPHLFNKEFSEKLFNAFFENLNKWYESSNVIPLYLNIINDHKIINLQIYEIWLKQYDGLKGFKNYQTKIYNLPVINKIHACIKDNDMFSNEMYKYLRNHHKLFKLFWKLNKKRIKHKF